MFLLLAWKNCKVRLKHGDSDFEVRRLESLNGLAIRVKSGMIELNKKCPSKNILLITHAGVLQTQGFDFNSISQVSVGGSRRREGY